MNRKSLIFGYQHTPFGVALFTLGCGVFLCTMLEQMGVGFHFRNASAFLLMAASGVFVRRRTTSTGVAG